MILSYGIYNFFFNVLDFLNSRCNFVVSSSCIWICVPTWVNEALCGKIDLELQAKIWTKVKIIHFWYILSKYWSYQKQSWQKNPKTNKKQNKTTNKQTNNQWNFERKEVFWSILEHFFKRYLDEILRRYINTTRKKGLNCDYRYILLPASLLQSTFWNTL